ncbi:hypothetical protein [Barnesiella sp. An55]|uniref:hypothetical protein n=1 Tax=Barnesiella sp. An55 TaxID=1965646 RepID=UPI000B56E113|nr:hypothetical protein [Barnesiella sp. An55]OUN73968.1 hypothetical protein B5G10_02770 [Barnesiella sp. An55]
MVLDSALIPFLFFDQSILLACVAFFTTGSLALVAVGFARSFLSALGSSVAVGFLLAARSSRLAVAFAIAFAGSLFPTSTFTIFALAVGTFTLFFSTLFFATFCFSLFALGILGNSRQSDYRSGGNACQDK